MWQAALQDPHERSAFHDLLEGYFSRPFPTSPGPTSRRFEPAPAAAPPSSAPAARAPLSYSSYSAPAPASPSSGPRQPAGLVQEQREDPLARVTSSPHYQAYKLSQAKTPTEAARTIGGMDASTKRAFAKAVFSSKGPLNSEEQRKKKESGPGPLAVAVPRTYAGPPPPRRAGAGPETGAPAAAAEERVRAMYDYAGTSAEDLPVREGDELVVVERVDADWTRCRSANGSVGLVPSSYVQNL
ncbi:hypothetical protein JCM8208_006217 [Rhodotorula glutinis]